MRDRFPLLLVAGVMLLASLGWFMVQGARRGDFADRLSTFKSGPEGARGLYLLLTESGLDVSRTQHDLTFIPPGQNLVLLGCRADETESAFKILAGQRPDAGASDDDDEDEEDDDDDADAGAGQSAQRAARGSRHSTGLSPAELTTLLEHVRNGSTLVYLPLRVGQDEILNALEVALERAEPSLPPLTLVPAQPSRYVQGVQRVVTKVVAFLELPSGAVPLLVDDTSDKPVAALVPYGQGRIIVIAAPELGMNRSLGVADNAQFWHSLVRAVSRSGPVYFDEFHHGFTGERSVGEFGLRYGLHFAIGQLLVGVAFWALALRRFGRPQAPPESVRRGSTDALAASSRLYREGKHHSHAAMSILSHLAADFAVRAGVGGKVELERIGAALEVRGRKDLAAALLEITRAAKATSSEADLLNVATLAALARKTLNASPPP